MYVLMIWYVSYIYIYAIYPPFWKLSTKILKYSSLLPSVLSTEALSPPRRVPSPLLTPAEVLRCWGLKQLQTIHCPPLKVSLNFKHYFVLDAFMPPLNTNNTMHNENFMNPLSKVSNFKKSDHLTVNNIYLIFWGSMQNINKILSKKLKK